MSQTFYPQHEEVDFSGRHCPNCGHETFSRCCWECGGDGCFDGYDEDPICYDPGDLIPCDNCRSEGYLEWCPRCRWDMQLSAKWNRPEHRGMAVLCLRSTAAAPSLSPAR